MNTRYSGPSSAYLKPNGTWSFDVFPHGIRTEFAEYPDEESARADAYVTMRRWQADGSYSFLSTMKLPLQRSR